ncbi:uncharacterized protein G2W53_016108 [Senna tora]|uniref:Uncharacterized protein n=1 Tax=Senna tora TaxID=362788 RepID=A0A835C8T6_9FABA|nr:uncharacterized protein G2W53_016108 [Senna tora]
MGSFKKGKRENFVFEQVVFPASISYLSQLHDLAPFSPYRSVGVIMKQAQLAIQMKIISPRITGI